MGLNVQDYNVNLFPQFIQLLQPNRHLIGTSDLAQPVHKSANVLEHVEKGPLRCFQNPLGWYLLRNGRRRKHLAMVLGLERKRTWV